MGYSKYLFGFSENFYEVARLEIVSFKFYSGYALVNSYVVDGIIIEIEV